jgi:hypothetical protein
MLRFQRLICAIYFCVLLAVPAFADVKTVEVKKVITGRTSASFGKRDRNRGPTIPVGSKVELLQVTKMKSGTRALKVRFDNQELWIRYTGPKNYSLLDSNGTVVSSDLVDSELENFGSAPQESAPIAAASSHNPASADLDTSNVDIGEDPNLARKSSNQTEAGFCANCKLGFSSSIPQKNYRSFKDVAYDVTDTKFPVTQLSNTIWDEYPKVIQYANDERTLKAIAKIKANKLPKSKRSCYRYVKFALADAQNKPVPVSQKKFWPAEIGPLALIEDLLVQNKAKNAIKELKSEGFINLLENAKYKSLISRPGDAPKGAVLIYRGGSAGHAEIKTDWGDTGEYISDFSRKVKEGSPHDGMPGRKLIGVMIREGGGQP